MTYSGYDSPCRLQLCRLGRVNAVSQDDPANATYDIVASFAYNLASGADQVSLLVNPETDTFSPFPTESYFHFTVKSVVRAYSQLASVLSRAAFELVFVRP
jgi:hypothetical protein